MIWSECVGKGWDAAGMRLPGTLVRFRCFSTCRTQTSCYQSWRQGIWTDYARELARRTEDILQYDFKEASSNFDSATHSVAFSFSCPAESALKSRRQDERVAFRLLMFSPHWESRSICRSIFLSDFSGQNNKLHLECRAAKLPQSKPLLTKFRC